MVVEVMMRCPGKYTPFDNFRVNKTNLTPAQTKKWTVVTEVGQQVTVKNGIQINVIEFSGFIF